MEVMGLMLGTFVDEYTVRVVDVFAMPQSGTGVSVEAVDPVYQKDMLDMLAQTKRTEAVVGWYHSHPGFGCWLSGVDQNTAQSFEQLNSRCVSVVVDPIQSVKGKVVIDAFRCIHPATLMSGAEPRQVTSVVGSLVKPTVVALVNGLNRHYYSLAIAYRKNALEARMLMNVHKKKWTEGLGVPSFAAVRESDKAALEDVACHAEAYAKRVAEETEKTAEQISVENVGKVDPKRKVETGCAAVFARNIAQVVSLTLAEKIF
jgi:26S proteasome regulatory subunit N11